MRWWWRKPADNFEWREYVRTTILVRRNERRQKVEDAKQAAIDGVKQAGHKGVEAGAAGLGAAGRASKAAAGAVGRGGVAAGSALGRGGMAAGSALGRAGASAATAVGHGLAAAGRASRQGLHAGGAAIVRVSAAGYHRLHGAAGPPMGRVRDATINRLEPAILALLRPSIAMPLSIVAVMATVGTAYRWAALGFDSDVAFAGTIAVIAVVLTLLPRLAVGDVPKPFAVLGNWMRGGANAAGRIPGLRERSGSALAGLAGLAVLAAVGWWLLGDKPAAPAPGSSQARNSSAASDIPSVAVTRLPDLKGRGSALSGDLVRVSGTTVRLSGVEAPERDQRCGSSTDRAWRCGQAARDALARLVRAPSLVCKLAGTDDNGYRLATCTIGDKDVAQEMVRGGHIFASTGFFATYGSAESEARTAKAGLWQDDNVQRPADYRAQRWAEAKQAAPEGCPIKGSISRGSRTYVLPWSSAYEKVRVRESRGERWFCSEQEARAAGWRPTSL